MKFDWMRNVAGVAVLCGLAAGGMPAYAAEAKPAERLPAQLPRDVATAPADGKGRAWTNADIVEVTRITGIAVESRKNTVAFTVQRPSIKDRRDLYGLYVVGDRPGDARKVLEATFISDLAARPGSSSWTIRADLGKGVQLYEIDAAGKIRPLVVNPDPALVGGREGVTSSGSDYMRPTGVNSYGWAPDGKSLWYKKFKLRSPAERERFEETGIVYDEAKMWTLDLLATPAALEIELHLLDAASGKDRILASAPGARTQEFGSFASPTWLDGRRILYRTDQTAMDGVRSISQHSIDTATGEIVEMKSKNPYESFSMAKSVGGRLLVRREDDGRVLVAVGDDGAVVRQYGRVPYTVLTGQSWNDPASGRSIFGVSYGDRVGLAFLPSTPAGSRIEQMNVYLNNCTFSADLHFGACSRESMDRAPELVSIDAATGDVAVLASPNERYAEIAPLKSVAAEWTNRFGVVNKGYITYPRNWQAGRKYPAIVVTHAHDARNWFAQKNFQWDYPIQSFAERGYLILSVNEAPKSADVAEKQLTFSGAAELQKMQHETVFNVVASMEAAAQAAIDQGLADPDRIGIAGFSRGGTVTTFALSQSKMFRTGSSGDVTWFASSGYWNGGGVGKGVFQALFGGSPLDPKILPNYLAISPSARADKFAGPLLQQFTAGAAHDGLELHQMLRNANVPTDMVFYRNETHVFHKPQTRADAMQLNLDWFDYWLLDKRDPDPAKAVQYRRWDAMAAAWRASQAKPVQ